MERYFDLSDETPFTDEVSEHYQPAKERIPDSNYKVGLELTRLIRYL